MTAFRARHAVAVAALSAVVGSCKSRDESHVGADSATQPRRTTSRSAAADTGASDAPLPSENAAPARVVEYYPASLLAHVGDSLSATPRTGHVLRNHPTFQTIALRRVMSGVPEVHDNWTDVMLFQAGRATVLLGGTVSGSRLTTIGEHRGGTVSGGHSQAVSAGDMLVIPAGMPHQIEIARGDSLRYITVKVPR
jgi:mannose-6-phosphate isomerase-like protein (cupin superfamily)